MVENEALVERCECGRPALSNSVRIFYGHLALREEELRRDRRGGAVEVHPIETSIAVHDNLGWTQAQRSYVAQVLELLRISVAANT